MLLKRHFVLLLALLACKPSAQTGPAEVRLATDLNPAAVDTALQLVVKDGGPRAERAAGAREGAAALSADAAVSTADIRWDSDPYGAMAAAAQGELAPAPLNARDVP